MFLSEYHELDNPLINSTFTEAQRLNTKALVS
ncbi:hypothetical protein ABIE12_003762 [Serratia sp. 509]